MVFKCYVFYKPFCVYVLTRAGVHLCVRAFPCMHVQTRGQLHCYTLGAVYPTSNLAHLCSLSTTAFKKMPVH